MIKQVYKYFNQRHRIILIFILCLMAFYATAQKYMSSQIVNNFYLANVPNEIGSQNLDTLPISQTNSSKKIIIIKHADQMNRSKFDPDVNVLKGNVQFYHDGTFLFCDSAYFNQKQNTFNAFDNSRMEQGDTIFLYSKNIYYNGNTNIAKARENVRLENGQVTLFTDSLDFDRLQNIGYYFDGGMLVDSLNELTSFSGQYEPNKNLATFSDSVKVKNKSFTLYSDTLHYDTQGKIVKIVSETKIVSDSGIINTTRGSYNTITQQSVLLDQSTIYNNVRDRFLRGDSIIYNKERGFGEVFGNMFLEDTTKKVILGGHYAFFDELKEIAWATDSAYAIEYSQGDSLYLHADTLKIEPDSIYKIMKAYVGVRFYRSDLQGVCDSMQFNSRDSVLHMYRDPIIWHEGTQISGDTIDVFMNDSTIDHMHVKRYSFSIEKKDSIMYNQIKGKSMIAKMTGGKINNIFVDGNAEAIFYPEDDKNHTTIGLNNMTSGFMQMDFNNDGKFERIKAWPQPRAKMTPNHLIDDKIRKLTDFAWLDYLRPINKKDIFRKVGKKESDIKEKKPEIPANLFDEFD